MRFEHGVAAREEGRCPPRLARMESLVHRDAAQHDRTVGTHGETEVAEAERLEGLEAVVVAAREVAEARALVVGIEASVVGRELRGGDVDARAGRSFDVERHGARHDLAEIHRDDVHGLRIARRAASGQRSAIAASRCEFRIVADHRRDRVVLRRSLPRRAPRGSARRRDALQPSSAIGRGRSTP